MFWFVAAIMTLLATAATIRPLLRTHGSAVSPRPLHDAEVYRAQLAELEADLSRGAIGADEVTTARAEIARRLLKSEEAVKVAASEGGDRNGRLAILAGLAVALLLPVGTFLFYDRAGSPDMSDQPLAGRAPPAQPSDISAMMAAVERRLAERPDDLTGWNVAAPVYLRLGDADKAATAYRNILRLGPPSAAAQAGLGEALVQKAGGEVTPDARQAFEAALALDPNLPSARFYLALGLSQTGRYAEAKNAWTALIDVSPAGAPWLALAQGALRDAEAKLGNPPPGPDAAAIEAAGQLSDTDRQAMIQGMVAQLASRLDAAPDDADGWSRLIRSYAVLGDKAKAEAAGRRALGVFPPETADGKLLLALAGSLGLNLSGDATTR